MTVEAYSNLRLVAVERHTPPALVVYGCKRSGTWQA